MGAENWVPNDPIAHENKRKWKHSNNARRSEKTMNISEKLGGRIRDQENKGRKKSGAQNENIIKNISVFI